MSARRLADGVYAVLGDTGRGSEGRPNAGFIVTHATASSWWTRWRARARAKRCSRPSAG